MKAHFLFWSSLIFWVFLICMLFQYPFKTIICYLLFRILIVLCRLDMKSKSE